VLDGVALDGVVPDVAAVGGAVVAVVAAAAVVGVVAAAEALAVAIAGETGEPEGLALVMPEVGMVSFGYAVQVRFNGALPGTAATDKLAFGSTFRLTAPPVAVNGPSVEGVAGNSRGMPAVGIGVGIGALNVMVPLGVLAGVAPVASTVADAVPVIAVLPRAWDAAAMDLGRLTFVS